MDDGDAVVVHADDHILRFGERAFELRVRFRKAFIGHHVHRNARPVRKVELRHEAEGVPPAALAEENGPERLLFGGNERVGIDVFHEIRDQPRLALGIFPRSAQVRGHFLAAVGERKARLPAAAGGKGRLSPRLFADIRKDLFKFRKRSLHP